jgi:hypothetical protein
MAARFLNRLAGIGATVGIGGFCLQECIYDGASSPLSPLLASI